MEAGSLTCVKALSSLVLLNRRPDFARERGVASYRFYFMDGPRIRDVEEFFACNDEAALAEAEQRRKGRPGELWNLARRVEAFQPVQRDELERRAV
jgi:hypothetical protein